MKFFEIGMGLFGWRNDEIAIVGGMRANRLHPAGKFFLNFTLVDVTEPDAEIRQKGIGKAMFLVGFSEDSDPVPEKWIELEIDKSLRKSGYGRKVVNAVRSISDNDIEVCDMKKNAVPFWKKMGVEPYPASKASKHLNGVLPAQEPISAPTP